MSDVATLIKEIEGLKANQMAMEVRLRELEANTPAPPYQGGESEITDEDLFYIKQNKGLNAYFEALKIRNKQRAVRMKEELGRAA